MQYFPNTLDVNSTDINATFQNFKITGEANVPKLFLQNSLSILK